MSLTADFIPVPIISLYFHIGMPEPLDFDPIIDELEQNPKLPEVVTKAPPVGRAAPCQSADWLGISN